MKKITRLLIALSCPALSFAQEVFVPDHLDRLIIKREFDLKDNTGKNFKISQKFLPVSDDQILYLKGSSSKDTLAFGAQYCQAKNQVLDIDYGVKLLDQQDTQYLISCSNDINMKNTLITQAASTPVETLHSEGFTNLIYYNDIGEKIIQRNSIAISPVSGKKYNIEQKFIELTANKLLYIIGSSSLETIQFQQEICNAQGAINRTDQSLMLISNKTTAGFSCSNIQSGHGDFSVD